MLVLVPLPVPRDYHSLTPSPAAATAATVATVAAVATLLRLRPNQNRGRRDPTENNMIAISHKLQDMRVVT